MPEKNGISINEKKISADDVSIAVGSSDRKPCRLDWAESHWIRWIYVILWLWLSPILKIGNKRTLTEDDLFDVSHNDECSRLLKKLEIRWEKEEKKSSSINTWKIVAKTFWKECLIAGLTLFPYIGARIAQPLFLKQIVLVISDRTLDAYIGYLYAIGLGLSALIQALIHQQFFFRTTRVGLHARIALSSLIYKRLLSLPTRAIMKTTTGQVINLISNDVSKFEDLSVNIHHIWSGPLEAAIAFGIIWNEIGIPTLFGYAVLLLSVPVQLFFSKKFGTYRRNTVQWTDKRVRVVNEILVGCQIVKMYNWEEALEAVVYDARANEFQSIRKASRIRAMNLGIFFSSMLLVSLATFGGSWLMGRELQSANLFTVLSLLGMIRYPLTGGLPAGIERLSESFVAARRINQFMNLSKETRMKTSEQRSNVNVDHQAGRIFMKGASFTWGTSQSAELIGIDLNISKGSFVGIIGAIGSSKSSLLAAILGEMSRIEGTSEVYGQLAYVSQTPWIFAGTIEENILFCKPMNKEKYDRVVEACCLNVDFRSFSAGDQTMIGEKGVNLSGGQKARVTLARAIYSDADIYLFDDPLAAVDRTVSRKIFQQCFSNEGILKNQTRILVTHQIQYLTQFDHCILLEQGTIEKQGSSEDLLTIEKVKQSHGNEQYHANENDPTKKRTDSYLYQSKTSDGLIDENSIVKEEVSIVGGVSIRVWLKLFTSGYGWIGLVLLILLMFVGEGAFDATNKWLSIWSSQKKDKQREAVYPSVYLGLVLGTSIIALIRADYFFHLILCGASALHNRMFKGVLFSSLRFYESNPVGRILNRFSKDQQVVDELLPVTFFDTLQSLIMVLGSIVIIGIANPWVLFILIPLIPIFLWLRRYYLQTSRSVKRIESVTRSPIYALFSSSLSGLMTIRAFGMENQLIELFLEKINRNTRAAFIFACSGRWFGLRLDLMTCCLTFLTAILSVALRQNMDPSSVALGLSYCITLTALFQWAVRQSAEVENFMTSAERIDQYSHLLPEQGFHHEQIEPPANWPKKGKIKFANYKLKYRPELPPVLKGLNLKIKSGKKIGIIGRTGAGKSSIFQALFRLIDKSSTEGEIFIDGIDINQISLKKLRSTLNIIPQSPVLFSNTLRYNLDPFENYTDEQLWNALEAVQLKTKIENLEKKLNSEVAEYGSNFSVGECQLICVARAILKPSQILLIDEATAHVDTQTDQLIQQILKDKFQNQTILTIAHRLNTVNDSDLIAVIKDGIIDQYAPPDQLINKSNQ